MDLPQEIAEALGESPERETLEALLLFLIREQRISVARAGRALGLGRQEAVRWYTAHGFSYPGLDSRELEEELRYALQDGVG